MSQQRLHGSTFEIVRIPVVGIYPGLRYGRGQHVVVGQPVDDGVRRPFFVPAFLPIFPCSRRFGA